MSDYATGHIKKSLLIDTDTPGLTSITGWYIKITGITQMPIHHGPYKSYLDATEAVFFILQGAGFTTIKIKPKTEFTNEIQAWRSSKFELGGAL